MSRELRVDKSNRSGAGELARITAEIMLKAAGIINDGSVTRHLLRHLLQRQEKGCVDRNCWCCWSMDLYNFLNLCLAVVKVSPFLLSRIRSLLGTGREAPLLSLQVFVRRPQAESHCGGYSKHGGRIECWSVERQCMERMPDEEVTPKLMNLNLHTEIWNNGNQFGSTLKQVYLHSKAAHHCSIGYGQLLRLPILSLS